VPVEHVHAEGQIGFLEGLLEKPEGVVAELAGSDYRQIKIGVALRGPIDARAESADLALRHIFVEDSPDRFQMVRGQIDHFAQFRSSMAATRRAASRPKSWAVL